MEAAKKNKTTKSRRVCVGFACSTCISIFCFVLAQRLPKWFAGTNDQETTCLPSRKEISNWTDKREFFA